MKDAQANRFVWQPKSGSKKKRSGKGKRSRSELRTRLSCERLEDRRMLASVTLLTPSSGIGDGTWTQEQRSGQSVFVGPVYLYYDVDLASDFPDFQVGDSLFAKVNYFDEGSGILRLQYDSVIGNFDQTEFNSRSSRVDSQQFVSSFHILNDVEFADGTNGRDFRVAADGAPISSVEISDQPFPASGLEWVNNIPWESAYVGPSRDDVDATTISGKVLAGYQGWFDTPNDAQGGGYRHWGEPGDWSVDAWPDPNDYDATELFAVPGATTASGEPAYLISSNNQDVVRRHFQWMRQHDIDGVLLQRFSESFMSPNPDGSYSGEKQWALVNARSSAHLEGRTWAVEYDIQMSDVTAEQRETRIQQVKDDWDFLTNSNGFDLLSDTRYLRQDGKPVVAIFGLYISGNNSYTTAQQTDLTDFFRSRGVYLIGAGRHSESANHVADAGLNDAYIPWMGYFSGGSSFTPADDALDGITEHIPHVSPGFSWTQLKEDADSAFRDREDGSHYWQLMHDAVQETDSSWIFVGMFDEYDEATHIMPASDDPPIPETDDEGNSYRFVTNGPRPNDWWLALTGQGKKALQGKISITDTQPTEAELENRSNTGGEVRWSVNESQRLSAVEFADGQIETIEVNHNGTTFDANFSLDPNLYFQVDDAFVYQESDGRDLTVEVEYLDSSVGSFALQYDSVDGAYVQTASALLTDSGQWRTHRFELSDAYFGNRQNAASDFRLVKSSGNLLVRRLRLSKESVLSVQADLGATNISDGLRHQASGGDGQSLSTNSGERDSRILTGDPSSLYLYMQLDDDFAHQVAAGLNAIVEVVYQDVGNGNLNIQYDSVDAAYRSAESVSMENTGQWRTARFYLDDAYFGNRQNDGSDFRITGSNIPIDQVRVLRDFGDLLAPELQTASASINVAPDTTSIGWSFSDDWKTGLMDQWTTQEDNRVRLEWSRSGNDVWNLIDDVFENSSSGSQSGYDVSTGRNTWAGEYLWDTSGLAPGAYQVRVTPIDGRGNLGEPNDSTELDLQPPKLLGITRESPLQQNTQSNRLVFRATFDEPIVELQAADFKLFGGSSAVVADASAVAGTGETVYLLTVSGGGLSTYKGVVGLDLAPSHDISDMALNQLGISEPAIDEVFVVGDAPQVQSLATDGGNSIVRSITIDFDTEVMIASDAFELTNSLGVPVSVIHSSTTVNHKTRASLFFTGSLVDETGSLVDGDYQLKIIGTKVQDLGGKNLDGNGSNAHVDDFFRLFGDSSGDRSVGLTDFAGLRQSFGANESGNNFNSAFDADGDGTIGLADFAAFRANFGKQLDP
ncbi:hypothetical protein LF1_28000 [Rubripirellula obstinata]|uniref:EF-hand domain-containing protein n=1 Tax=Rubripirellula obstinata TaxID=406547 RepID=A0A5B1CJ31_9BACT|nr:hypothetical protein [Rubripirellula obstinata]KAA1260261.1 hypothetical protein LF1_28000 [Rubripirellula obstinata]